VTKLTTKVRVKNKLGLHTRPATAIVQMLQGCTSEVWFRCGGELVNAKSLLNLLMLAAARNTQITIIVEGEEAEAKRTMDELVTGFASSFGE